MTLNKHTRASTRTEACEIIQKLKQEIENIIMVQGDEPLFYLVILIN